MLNPWVLLGLAVAFAVSNLGSFFYGQKVEAGAQARAREAAVVAALDDAKQNAEKDKQAAVEAAKKEAFARGRAATLRSKGHEAIAATPQPASCDWSPDAFGVLVAAVRDANGAAAADPGLRNAVRRANGTGERPR